MLKDDAYLDNLDYELFEVVTKLKLYKSVPAKGTNEYFEYVNLLHEYEDLVTFIETEDCYL